MYVHLTMNVCVMYNKLHLPWYIFSTQLDNTQSTL